MDKSYLIELLRSLDQTEFDELNEFISSPYFVKGKMGQEARTLFALLSKESPFYVPDRIKKENVYKDLFPEEPWIEGKIEKVMSELYKIARTYLLSKEYFSEENEFENQLKLAKIYRNKNIDLRYHQAIKKIEFTQNSISKRNTEYYFNQYLLEYEKLDYESYFNKHRSDLNIPNVISNLDTYYYSKKLEIIIQFIFQTHAIKIEIPEHLLLNIKNLQIPEQYLINFPILRINFLVINLLISPPPSLEELENLDNEIDRNEGNLDNLSLRNYSAHLRNLCSINSQSGIPGLEQFDYDLRKKQLEKGYMYYKGKLPPGALFGLTRQSLEKEENDWALNFIENHKNLVIGDNETLDYYRLAKAFYFFSQKQFESALDILPNSFNEPRYLHHTKTMELQIYYELSSDLLSYKLDAFKMYVARTAAKNTPPNEQKMLTNFVNILIQLSTSSKNDKKRSEQIIRRIEQKKLVTKKDWLLEKARELSPLYIKK